MKKILIFLTFLGITTNFLCKISIAQVTPKKSNEKSWSTNDPFKTDVFIENMGQFDNWAKTSEPIKYGINKEDKIFFSLQGLTYCIGKTEIMTREEREEIERITGKEPIPKREIFSIHMQWVDCNTDAVIEVQGETENYYTFGEKGYENVKAKGYKKLTYKNIYDGIDIEYLIPDKGGIKYSVIIHPGADVSKVKMKYSGDVEKINIDNNGNILVNTPAGAITDHAPQSFYEGGENIKSEFELNGNTVSFKLSQPVTSNQQPATIVIDPWTTTPTSLSTDNAAYDVDVDNAGNVFVSGGTAPTKLAKYSPAGTIIWTYTYPGAWGPPPHGGPYYYSKPTIIPQSGTFLIGEPWNPNGPRIMKINSAGVCVYTSPNFLNTEEIWQMLYNRCTGELIAFGGGTADMNNIQVLADTNVNSATAINFNGCPDVCNDVTSAVMDYNGDFYTIITQGFLTPAYHNRLSKNLVSSGYNPPCTFSVATGYNFTELSNNGIPGFIPIVSNSANALALNSNYLFSYDGKTLIAWNKTTGALLSSLVVNASYTGGVDRTNQGLDVDDCNNVYVGGSSIVHVYSFNGSSFTPLSSITTNITGKVYGIHIDKPSNVLYVSGLGFVTVTPVITCTLNPLVLTNTVDGCAGSATVIPSGGVAPYTYLWSNGETTASVTGLATGTYYVTVHDNSCVPFAQIDTVTIVSSMVVDISNDTSICSSANVILQASGAASYIWSTGASTATITVTPSSTTTYTVTVSDGGGTCTAVLDVVVTVSNNLSANATSTPSLCTSNDGSATVTVTGGSVPYTYLWSPSGQTTATATALGSGTYSVTVTDQNGCTQTSSVVVVSTSGISATTSTVDVLCNGASTGSSTVTVSGGTAPFTYAWSNSQTGATAANLAAGTYTVSITDYAGCTTVQSATINEPSALAVTTSPASICLGDNADVGATPSGGTSPYTYNWSSGGTTAQINVSPTVTTTYTITVTDANACSVTDDVLLTLNPAPSADAGNDQGICEGETAGLNASGGTTYAWSPVGTLSNAGVSNPTASPTATTTYTLTVTDVNGCTDTDTVTINVGPLPVISVAGSPETCGRGDGTATITGSAAYTYQWSSGQTTQTLTGLPQGTYTVTVGDGGCTSTDMVIIGNIPGPNAEFSAHPRILTILESDGIVSFLDNSSGNVVSWQWTLGDGSTASTEQFDHVYNEIGTYVITLLVTDNNGCVDSITDTIIVKDIFTVYIPNAITPDGNGYNDFFFPQGVNWDPDNFEMYIFDRWGQLIYETKTIGDKWNGTVWNEGSIDDQFIDVYVYLIRVKEIEGPKHEYIGRVTVVR